MNELPIDVLVNKENLLPSDYYPRDLVATDENENNIHEYQDSKRKPMIRGDIYPYYKKMIEDAKTCGLEITVDSGYRSYDYQQNVLDDFLAKFGEEAYQKVALPGASEHQTGLAFDFGYYRDGKYYLSDFVVEEDPEAVWMKENAHNYGFVLRYPKGKEEITGFQFEPWHFRFVGLELAKELFDEGITLDEYYARKVNGTLKR